MKARALVGSGETMESGENAGSLSVEAIGGDLTWGRKSAFWKCTAKASHQPLAQGGRCFVLLNIWPCESLTLRAGVSSMAGAAGGLRLGQKISK